MIQQEKRDASRGVRVRESEGGEVKFQSEHLTGMSHWWNIHIGKWAISLKWEAANEISFGITFRSGLNEMTVISFGRTNFWWFDYDKAEKMNK